MDGVLLYESLEYGYEMRAYGDCKIQLGGRDGDGFCYAHQSFDCLDRISAADDE